MAELMKSIQEMNEKSKRKNVYILIAGGYIFASTAKYDIDDYLKADDSLVTPWTDLEDVSLLYGFQMDTEEMPFELSSTAKEDKFLWIIYDDGSEIICDKCDHLSEVTEVISRYLKEDDSLKISDFIVILGVEMNLVMTVGASGPYIQESTIYN